MSYLGKISAIVSANTSDFKSKISGAGKDVSSWASSVTNLIGRASSNASSSLRSIYTDAQKVSRSLAAVREGFLNYKGFDAKDLGTAIGRMEALYSITKQINQPLSQAARSLEKLPQEIQAGFLPAMISAQTATERLAAEINETGSASQSQFAAVADKVDLVTASMRRLQEVSGMVGNLSRGDSFKFMSPRSFDALAAAGRAQRAGENIPAAVLAKFGVGDQQGRVRAAADRVAQLESRRERRMALGLSTNRVDAMIEGENDRLEAQVRVYGRLIEAAQKYMLILKGGFVSSEDLVKSANFLNSQEGASVDIRQRVRDQQEAARRIQEAAIRKGQQELGREIGTSRLNVLQDESDLLTNQGASSSLRSGYFTSAINRDLEATRSIVKNLGDTPLAGTLGPQLDTLSNKFGILTRDAKLSADQIRQINEVSREAEAIRGAVASRKAGAKEFLSGAGGMGRAGLDLRVDQKSLQGYAAEIELIQSKLTGFSATARGPVVAALESYRRAAAKAFKDGSINTEEGRKKLEQYRAELVKTASQLTGIPVNKLTGQLKRVGDVARGSFGNLGLAVQQAAFAVDDFMSVTGGLDQRIRAAGNNISQLAFIIGQTKGLIIGIAISIGAQLVAALIKWANKGRTAEDQLKALNDAMKRQKQLAMELADAFDTLGESIVDRMFADGENQIRKFNKSLEDLIKKQKEARQEFLGELNPTLVGNRTRQATIERQLASEKTDLTERMRLQQELDRLRREEKEFMAAPNAQLSGVQEALEKAFEGYLQDQGYDASPERRQDARDMAQQAMDEVIRGAGSPEEAIAIIRELKQKLGTMQGSILFPGRSDRDAGLAALEQLERVVTQNAVASKTDAGIISFVNALSDAQVSISAAQELLQGFEFSPLRKEIIDTANKMDAAKNAIVEAERAYQESTTKTIEEAQARDAVVAEQNKVIEGLKEQAAAQRAAAESVKNFDDVMKRISGDLVNTVEGEARSLADSARREANRATAQAEWGPDFDQSGQRVLQDDLWFNAEFAQERRRDAEVAARKIEEMAISAREEQERLRIEFEQSMAGDPEVMRKRARLQELQAVLDDKNSTEDEKRAASLEKEDILRQQRIRFEGSPQGREAAKQADWVNQAIEEQRARFMQEDGEVMAARRGRDIGLRDGVLAARDAANAIKDIAQARNLQMLDTDPDGFIVGRARRNEILADAQASEFARQQMRSAAPAIFEMADAVTNAVLQGPSRQALEVSDVSTMEGSRELNRLLRGDDASKNANIVELQKQNATLTEIKAALQEAAQNAGIVLDLRG